MAKSKGIIHLLPLILFIAIIIVGVVLISKGIIKKPFSSKEPKVELKTDYKNPFDKSTQYVNPFDEFKNPFANLR